jgi:cytochrome b561
MSEPTMSEPTWPRTLRLLHWVSAVLVFGALGLGTYMVQLVDDPAERFDLTQTHKTVGVAVFALTVVRLCLRALAMAPRRARPLLAAKAAHAGLYALLLLLPASGWLMATATPVRVPTVVLGLFTLPYPLAPDLAMYRVAHGVHAHAAGAPLPPARRGGARNPGALRP